MTEIHKIILSKRINVNHAIGYHCCHCRQYWDNENSRPKPSCQTDFGFVGVWVVLVDGYR